jgi:hypothetical protein
MMQQRRFTKEFEDEAVRLARLRARRRATAALSGLYER